MALNILVLSPKQLFFIIIGLTEVIYFTSFIKVQFQSAIICHFYI